MPRLIFSILLLTLLTVTRPAYTQTTYAEKLGFPKNARVLILHVDDAGMSWDSNQGAIRALEKGVATSVSVMMPCPWVLGFVHYIKEHPAIDAGLHLTLTSEWKDYRWSPLTGKPASPGLVDTEGAFWPSVEEVTTHASADEVEAEIRAQLARAQAMGFQPTHLDSHMGTLFAKPEFLERYIKVGMENKIPVMLPGGHDTMISEQLPAPFVPYLRMAGENLWNAGLPVLDDLHNLSYDWKYPTGELTDAALQKFSTGKYMETIRQIKPGLTMVIMHCTSPTEVFSYISNSGKTRKGDLLAMIDPALKKFLEKEGFILTTWREVKERRDKLK